MLKNRHFITFLIGVIITAVSIALLLAHIGFFEAVENKLIDIRFRLRGAIHPPDTVIIAALDEQSIEQHGRWPWSRDKIAQLVKMLSDSGAEIVMYDIIFSETEPNDTTLSNAMNDSGNVILPMTFDFNKPGAPLNQSQLHNNYYQNIQNAYKFEQIPPINAKGIKLPVEPLANVAMAIGHINMLADSDGTLRWETMAIEHNGYLFPSIDLQVAASYLGVPQDRIVLDATQGIQLGKKRYIPTNHWGQMLIHYYGPSHTFTHISISDILDGKIAKEQLYGKIILIGATEAKGIFDLRVTPFTAEMAGIEKHASVIASILDDKFLKSVPRSANILVILFFGLFLSVTVSRVKAIGGMILLIATLVFLFLSGYYLFTLKGFWLNLTYPAVNILFIVMTGTAFRYAIEERSAKQIRDMFSSYVTARVVDELIKNPNMAKLGGEKREVTILFSDLRGFTTFSEKHSPEDAVQILNEYLTAMTEVVFRWEGTLDKFIGDAILVFWGAPLKQENHAELAVKCALNMVQRLVELQNKWKSEGKYVLDCGIGINTGAVLVGNIGAVGKKMDYTVIGDHVNLCSRIESLTRKYETRILITEYTLEKIRHLIAGGGLSHVSIAGLDNVIVKGKEKPVTIYQLMNLDAGSSSMLTELGNKEAVKLTEK